MRTCERTLKHKSIHVVELLTSSLELQYQLHFLEEKARKMYVSSASFMLVCQVECEACDYLLF